MFFEPLSSEKLDFKHQLLEAIAPQYNNADFSDVTFNVGDKKYCAHRFLLAAQSRVFQAMLTGPHWKESTEKVIVLEEESAESEAIFPFFLQFFYTGKIRLEYSNVCAIHTLADKYELLAVKKSCVNFMTETLRGQSGVTLIKAVEWLPYVEKHIPELVCDCYRAIRYQFHGLLRPDVKLQNFDVPHLRAIFRSSESELIVPNELFVYKVVQEWLFQMDLQNTSTVVTELMDCIRFHNMDPNQLRSVEESKLGKLHYSTHLRDFINQAFRKQAEYRFLADSSPKRPKLDIPTDSTELPMEPRLYTDWPFGDHTLVKRPWDSTDYEWIDIEVVDLTSVTTFANKLADRPISKAEKWMCKWNTDNFDCDSVFQEEYIVYPSPVHESRSYTLVIMMDGTKVHPNHTYTIRMKGSVQPGMLEVHVSTLIHTWKIHKGFKLSVIVLLDKKVESVQIGNTTT